MSADAAPRVAILGLGLIGGSLAGALQGRGWHRSGWDPDPGARRTARRRGWLERTPAGAAEALEGADLVVLAAPPAANLAWLEELAGRPGRATVTDTGSVKTAVARRGEALLGRRFVPGHPMAGKERGGAAAADPDLFRGAAWVLCGGSPRRRARVARMVRCVGARPVIRTPAAHDREVAAVSHVPQLLASLLVGEAARRRPGALELAGPGFRGWARLAASPPELWSEILGANADAVRAELAALERALAGLRSRWERDDNAPLGILRRGGKGSERLFGSGAGGRGRTRR